MNLDPFFSPILPDSLIFSLTTSLVVVCSTVNFFFITLIFISLLSFFFSSLHVSLLIFFQSSVYSSGILNLASPPSTQSCWSYFSISSGFFSVSQLLGLPVIQFTLSLSPDNVCLQCLFLNADQWWMAMCVHTLDFSKVQCMKPHQQETAVNQ